MEYNYKVFINIYKFQFFLSITYIILLSMIYLTRHLERIDDSNSSVELNKVWNSLYIKEYEFNPFITDINSIDNISNKLKDLNFDIIISSPFLRCIQTALLLKENLNIKSDILIDMGLGEIFIEDIFYKRSKQNHYTIFNQSINFLLNDINFLNINKDHIKNIKLIDSNQFNILDEYETDKQYNNRIIYTFNKIIEAYSCKKILIVSHAHVYNALSKNNEYLQYGIPKEIDIENIKWK